MLVGDVLCELEDFVFVYCVDLLIFDIICELDENEFIISSDEFFNF